ncbi:hypothetical protein PanWU01x14_161920 [Parasponia andersonii]|uniref:Uncharacterized protein n=1 Tax=Parasponia andersonii TaxID=3476 RepID=A0A2P5CDD0_PARAD|nr:hypothetical protein PanWU01x14_161920 [Parasponia andersonii]
MYQVEVTELSDPRNMWVLGKVDPRDHEGKNAAEPVEALMVYKLDLECPKREVDLGSNLTPEQRSSLSTS